MGPKLTGVSIASPSFIQDERAKASAMERSP
jgi:hypothetical protein